MNQVDAAATPRIVESAQASEGHVGRELVGADAATAITHATERLIARRARARELREMASLVVNGGHAIVGLDWLLETAQLLDGRTLEQAAQEND